MSNIEFSGSLIEQAKLQSLNTLAVPARARYLIYVDDLTHLRAALDFARHKELDVLVLGEGSNLVLSADFSGLVICNRFKGIELMEQKGDEVLVRVAAGENWHAFVEHCVSNGWNGVENLALIPGLAGAAPIQNIGAYGVELSDIFVSLEYVDIESGELHSLNKQECEFSYRSSVFKGRLKNKSVVTQLTLKLNKSDRTVLKYPALAEVVQVKARPRDVFTAVCDLRTAKLPDPAKIPNAGSFFKNPIVSRTQLHKLQEDYPKIVSFPFADDFKLAAAWLIDKRGWKSRSHRGVRVHQHQALVITNPEKASGADILSLADQIRDDIFSSFGIELEIEPTVI